MKRAKPKPKQTQKQAVIRIGTIRNERTKSVRGDRRGKETLSTRGITRHVVAPPLTIGLLFCERMYSVVASWYSRVMVWAGPAAAGRGRVSGGSNMRRGSSMSEFRAVGRERGRGCRTRKGLRV
jgi:hypothetical protein